MENDLCLEMFFWKYCEDGVRVGEEWSVDYSSDLRERC